MRAAGAEKPGRKRKSREAEQADEVNASDDDIDEDFIGGEKAVTPCRALSADGAEHRHATPSQCHWETLCVRFMRIYAKLV